MSFRITCILCLASLVLLFADGVMGEPSSRGESHSATSAEDKAAHRQREGTRLADQLGYFRGSGDGLIFHLRDSDEKYPALENLALERVGKVMSDRHDHPDQLNWVVSGFFTEYRGANYLFITHAVLQNNIRRRTVLP